MERRPVSIVYFINVPVLLGEPSMEIMNCVLITPPTSKPDGKESSKTTQVIEVTTG